MLYGDYIGIIVLSSPLITSKTKARSLRTYPWVIGDARSYKRVLSSMHFVGVGGPTVVPKIDPILLRIIRTHKKTRQISEPHPERQTLNSESEIQVGVSLMRCIYMNISGTPEIGSLIVENTK